MKFQIVSDIHLEFADIDIKNAGADVLIMAGDILVADALHKYADIPEQDANPLGAMHEKAIRFRNFLKRVASEFNDVVYVAGNHEFYHGHWFKTIDTLAKECDRLGIHYLENGIVEFDKYRIIGGTLWTDVNKGCPITEQVLANGMNDFRVIRNEFRQYAKVRPMDAHARHKDTINFFSKAVDPQKTNIIVSHHAPSFESVPKHFRSEVHMNGGYASDLHNFVNDTPGIALWVHGHMHDPVNYTIGNTIVRSNPRGYKGYETAAWDWTGQEVVVEL